MSFLVVPFLHGGSGSGVFGGLSVLASGMADLAIDSSTGVLGLSLVSPLSREAGGGKATGRNRKATCRGSGGTALANHREPGTGHRGQGPYFAPAPAAGAGFCGRGGEGTGFL